MRQLATPVPALWWILLLGLCALLLMPLWLVDVPPLMDYPNHLARLFVLTHGAGDVHLSRFYEPQWAVIPDLGIDVLGLMLLPWLSVHVAGRIIVGVVLLLPVLGAVAYGSAMAGRRSWWALGSVQVAFHQSFLLGFLNFNAGMGLALLLAAIWVRWRDHYPRWIILVALLGGVGLFFCHLMGVVFFAILAGAHEMAWIYRHRRHGGRVIALRIGASALVFSGPLILFGLSSLAREASQPGFLSLSEKFLQLQAPWINYHPWLDAIGAGASVAVIAVLLLRHRADISLRARITLGLVALAYAISPAEFASVSNIDLRFVILSGFLLFCVWAPPRVPPWAVMVLSAVFLSRIALLGMLWHGHAETITQLRQVIKAVPAGSTVHLIVGPQTNMGVLSARRLSNGLRMDGHMPALLVIERRAWWPYLFDYQSQQPITTRSPYRELVLRVDHMHGLPGSCDLEGINLILWLGIDAPAVAYLDIVATSDVATLLQVRNQPCPGR